MRESVAFRGSFEREGWLMSLGSKKVTPPPPPTRTYNEQHKLLTIPLSRFASSHHIAEVSQHSMPYWEKLRPRPRLPRPEPRLQRGPHAFLAVSVSTRGTKSTEWQLVPVFL